REVMDRRAVDAGDVQFFDLAYLEVDVRSTGKGAQASRRIKVRLKDFVIPNTDLLPDDVRSKIRKWSDYIDYWAVDWDFRDDTFVNQWQTYRTRRDRSLAVETPEHTYEAPGKYRILVKVVDIFGNDTSHLLEWEAKERWPSLPPPRAFSAATSPRYRPAIRTAAPRATCSRRARTTGRSSRAGVRARH